MGTRRGNETTLMTTTIYLSEDANGLIIDHRSILNLIVDILEDVQQCSRRAEEEYFRKLQIVRNQCDRKSFPKILFRAMIIPFRDKDQSPYSKRLIAFFLDCALNMDHKLPLSEPIDKDEAYPEPFSLSILRCCVKHHPDEDSSVRSNITQLSAKIMDCLIPVDYLKLQDDKKLLIKVKEMFLHRIRDKIAQIRAYAALGLKMLQLEEDKSICEVTRVLTNSLRYDLNPEVRRAALKSLEVNYRTREYIVNAVGDVSEVVRLAAHSNAIKKLHIDSINVDLVEQFVQMGLTDASMNVRKRSELVVLHWLSECDNDVIAFLTRFDPINNKNACNLALNCIFKECTTMYFKKVNMALFGEDKLISLEKLGQEVAFYWKFVIMKFSSIPLCAELLVPSIRDMIIYTLKFMAEYEKNYAREEHGSTVFQQLLEVLLLSTKMIEEGGRRELSEFVWKCFNFYYLEQVHVRILMELFYRAQIMDVEEEFYIFLQRLLEENKTGQNKRSQVFQNSQLVFQNSEPPVKPTAPSDDQIRAIKLQIATLIHERHKLIREKDMAVMANNYLKAHELQLKVDELATEADVLRVKMTAAEHQQESEPGQSSVCSSDCTTEEEEEEEVPTPVDYEPRILEVAISAFFELIRRSKKISSFSRSFYENFVRKSILCPMENVRELVIKCMGIMGVTDLDEAKASMAICTRALVYDEESVQLIAYRVIFDLVLHFGFDAFEDNRIQNLVREGRDTIVNLSNSLLEDYGHTLKMLILERFRATDTGLLEIGVTGLIRLHLADRVCFPKIISMFLVMWVNPIYDCTKIVQEITVWLEMYVKLGLEKGITVANALVPSLRKIMYAGSNSPLLMASPEKLMSFVANATNSTTLGESLETPEVIHERIANELLDEMSNLGSSTELPILAKGLKFLSLRKLKGKSLETLLRKSARLLKMNINRIAAQSLSAFMKYLNSELLLVEDKQIRTDDTGSSSSDSEESVHISDPCSSSPCLSDAQKNASVSVVGPTDDEDDESDEDEEEMDASSEQE